MHKKSFFLIIVICAIIAVFLLIRHAVREQDAASTFFRTTLQAAHVSETIVLGQKRYYVADGSVRSATGETVSGSETFQALRVAYALTLARRSPLLAIPGVDLDALKQGVGGLEEVQKKLAEIQNTKTDKSLVASALYPISFLKSIAATEEARRAFLLSGSDADENKYQVSLSVTINSFKSDLAAYKSAFESVVDTKERPYMLLDGTVSPGSVLTALSELGDGIHGTETALTKRSACLKGNIEACDPSDVQLPMPEPVSEPQNVGSDELPPLAKEVRSLFADALKNPAFATSTAIELSESSCVQNLPQPYYFVVQDQPRATDSDILPIAYIGDIFAYRTADFAANKNAGVIHFLSDHNVSYYPAIMTAYYQCEDSGSDMGRIFGVLATADFARQNPSLSPEAAGKLAGKEVLSEANARTFVRDALSKTQSDTTTSKETLDGITAISLVLDDNSAGFDRLVSEIVAVENDNLRMKDAGIPVDMSANYFFFVRSAFLSLFLAGNPSVVAGKRISLFENHNAQDLLHTLARWSDLRSSTPQKKITADMSYFLLMHQSPEAAVSGGL
jgi:hypothetical protein